jgi:Co/Zn/Cd efflux system component
MEDSDQIRAAINQILDREFHIHHSTIQFERAGLPGDGLYMPQKN